MVSSSSNQVASVINPMQEMFPSVQDSIIGHRIVGEVYLAEEDYENAIKVSESGLELLAREEISRGIKLPA